jgi:hypothetical protein
MGDLAAFGGRVLAEDRFTLGGPDGMGIAWHSGNDGTGRALPKWRAMALFGDFA